jgi:hypothetical protein
MKKITESQLQSKVTSLRERLKMYEVESQDKINGIKKSLGDPMSYNDIVNTVTNGGNMTAVPGQVGVNRDVPPGFKKQFPTEFDIPNKYKQAPGSDITDAPNQVAPVAPQQVAPIAPKPAPTAPSNPSVGGASGPTTAPTAQTPPVSAKPWAAPKELQDLADKNGIKITPDGRAMIRPGQEITLADGSKYTVAAGDNLWNIWKGKYKGAQPKPAEDPIAAQIEKDKGNVQNTPQVNHGPSTDEEGNLYPGWSRDENNNPVWVGDQDGKTFVEPATQALADKARQDAANKVAPVQNPDGQGTQTSPAPVAPAPARPTNTVQGGWTDSSGNPVTSGSGQQIGSGSTPAVIDYTKPDPKPTKDSLGQTCEYGVPVDKEGNFIPPNKALPRAEYQKQLEAYNTWKKDYLKRWPDATFDPNTGKANNGLKPFGTTAPVTTPQGTFTPKSSDNQSKKSVPGDKEGAFMDPKGEISYPKKGPYYDPKYDPQNTGNPMYKQEPKKYGGTPSVSNMAEEVSYGEEQALARIIQLARI